MAPLVSILTRTLGRPCLADAAACVAAQTYRPIEWLVVDAGGQGVEVPRAGDVETRVVGCGERMLRSRAGNFGLEHARGDRAILLDDDDLLLPRAVELLSSALDGAPGVRLAYGDIAVETEVGYEYVYRFDYSELLLLKRNLFPFVAAMFDLALVRDEGIRLDETLDCFEDWDFWLQVSAHTPFAHVRETTSIYRLHLSQSGAWDSDSPDRDPGAPNDADVVAARYAARRLPLERAYEAKKREARELAERAELMAAAKAWVAAHRMLPTDEEPVLGYAAAAARLGDPNTARQVLQAALERSPGSEACSGMLAYILERQGDAEGARKVLADAANYRESKRVAEARRARR